MDIIAFKIFWSALACTAFRYWWESSIGDDKIYIFNEGWAMIKDIGPVLAFVSFMVGVWV